MLRSAVRVLIVAGLVGIGWGVGRAQSAVPDFELTVSTRSGTTEITCVRGCAITWAPTVIPKEGPVDIHVPTATLRGTVNSDGPQGCVAPDYSRQNCRIWGYARR